MRVLYFMFALVGCAASATTDDPFEPDAGAPNPEPVPMDVGVDWIGGGAKIEEIEMFYDPYGESDVAVQLKLEGWVTGPAGTTMKVEVNGGGGTWEANGLSSLDYTSGSCGSWDAVQTQSYGLICHAPGDSREHVPWSYSEAQMLRVHGSSESYVYTADYRIRVYDGTYQIGCRFLRLLVDKDASGITSDLTSFECNP